MMPATPTLQRVVVVALVIALAANVLLWPVSTSDDVFADIVAVASGFAAAVIVAAAVWTPANRWADDALLVAFAAWVANLIEFALEDGPTWETRCRQCGFYAAFAVLAVGAYLARRAADDRPAP